MNISVRYMNLTEIPLEDYLPSFPLVALGKKKKVCRINIENPEETYLMEKKH